MLEPIPVREGKLSALSAKAQGDRLKWLSLACELDRLRVLRVLREASAGFHVHTVLDKIASVAPAMPGRLGKWFRGASVAATAFRIAILALKS